LKDKIKNKVEIPFIVLLPLYLLFISLFVFQVHNFSNLKNSPISLSNIHKLFSIILAWLLLVYFFIKFHKFKNFPLPLWIYFLYLIIGLIGSVILSPFKGYSLYKILEVFTDFLLAVYIWTLSSFFANIVKYVYKLIIKYYKFLIIVTLLGILIFPSEALRPPTAYGHALLPWQLFGTIIQINADGLGMMAAIVFVISVIRYFYFKKGSKSDLLWTFISLVVLIFAQSRTAILATSLVLLLLFVFLNKKINWLIKIIILIILVLIVFYLQDIITAYLTRGLNNTQIENLSGRKIWWLFAINEFIHWNELKQLFGTGFMVGSRLILVKLGQGGASSLHSDYMDVLMSSGLIGEILFILFILSSFIYFIKNLKYIYYSNYLFESFAIVILLTIRTFTGPTLASHSFFVILYFIIILLSNEEIKKIKRKVLNE